MNFIKMKILRFALKKFENFKYNFKIYHCRLSEGYQISFCWDPGQS
jgi:hypothetical protein